MDNLSATVPGINPGARSVVSLPTERIEPNVPIQAIDPGAAVWIPERLIDQDPLGVVYKVFPYLDTFARSKGQACVWESYRSMARKTGLCDGSIRRALDCLEALGWICREDRDLDGDGRTFIWLRWLLPQARAAAEPGAVAVAVPVEPAPAATVADEDRYEYRMPGGQYVGMAEMERKAKTPRVQPGATRAQPGATRAQPGAPCAQPGAAILPFAAPDRARPAPNRAHPAPNRAHIHISLNGNGIETGTGSGSSGGNRPEPGAAESATVALPEQVNTPPTSEPTEHPPLPDLKPGEADQMEAQLRRPLIRSFDLTVQRACWASLFYRDLLPADLAETLPGKLLTDKFPEMPPRSSLVSEPTPKRSPPPPAAAIPVPATPAKPTTMLGRLRALGDRSRSAEDLEGDVRAIACDLADQWNQAGWVKGFAQRLRLVTRGERSGLDAAEAYGRATSDTAENPGAVFMNAMIEP